MTTQTERSPGTWKTLCNVSPWSSFLPLCSALGWSEQSACWTMFQPSGRYDKLIFTLLLQKSFQQQGLPAARKLSVIKRLTEFLLCGHWVCQCWSIPTKCVCMCGWPCTCVWFILECCTVPGSSLGTLWGFNGWEATNMWDCLFLHVCNTFAWQTEFFSKCLLYGLYVCWVLWNSISKNERKGVENDGGAEMLHGSEMEPVKKRQEAELEVAEVKMWSFSLGETRMERINV